MILYGSVFWPTVDEMFFALNRLLFNRLDKMSVYIIVSVVQEERMKMQL